MERRCRRRGDTLPPVIPGRCAASSPQSIGSQYKRLSGFRARRFAAPRNDAGKLGVSLPCQSSRTKIFHFTEIRICRICRPSRLILEGRSCGRHVREPGLRWTRQRRARKVRAGRVVPGELVAARGRTALPGFVSSVSFQLRRQGWENCGEMAGRAYGKTVWSWPSLLRSSSCGGGSRVNRRGAGECREGEGGQNELGSRESTA